MSSTFTPPGGAPRPPSTKPSTYDPFIHTYTRAGYIDSTPDGVPGIREIPQVPGFILAAGFSGHGFGIGLGAGHRIADLVSGAKPIFDPTSFDPGRFNQSSWGKVADF